MSDEPALVSDERDGETTEADDVDTAHLDDVEPGAGCTEIWEHLSERREQAGSD
ncbi:hypothetical protein [Salinigranum sp.]|jgi:hypothetical protein|uniref:hypothetical protein n=1 Tax=Salinigranum sp. TaxID=1966351 RepID=UPI003566FCA9